MYTYRKEVTRSCQVDVCYSDKKRTNPSIVAPTLLYLQSLDKDKNHNIIPHDWVWNTEYRTLFLHELLILTRSKIGCLFSLGDGNFRLGEK